MKTVPNFVGRENRGVFREQAPFGTPIAPYPPMDVEPLISVTRE
jgi:hypothetical protein